MISDGLLRAAQDAIPLLEYHNRWKSLTAADVTSMPKATWTNDLKGFKQPSKDINAADVSEYGAWSGEVETVPRNNVLWLEMMVRICRAHGSVPVLVSSPSPKNWTMGKHEGIVRVANTLGVEYIDLNLVHKDIGIDWQHDTFDAGDHLNYYGAVKASRYMGELLAKKYGLQDHREDPNYSSWNESYERYAAAVA